VGAQGGAGFARSRAFAAWCRDHRIALMATDTFAVEVLPVLPESDVRQSAPEDAVMMHQELIAELGLPLGELWNLTALAADCRATGRRDSLLTVKPIHLTPPHPTGTGTGRGSRPHAPRWGSSGTSPDTSPDAAPDTSSPSAPVARSSRGTSTAPSTASPNPTDLR